MIADILNQYCGDYEVIGVLYSADYCKWCKSFVPILMDVYPYLLDKGIDILMVGSDKTEESHAAYAAAHPWRTLPYGDERGSTLRSMYEIKTIPALLFFKRDGSLLVHGGRSMVEKSFETVSCPESTAHVIAGNCGMIQYDSDDDDF